MSTGGMLIALGILVMLAPFSGVPASWQEFILPAIGLAVALIGYFSRAKRDEPKEEEAVPVAA